MKKILYLIMLGLILSLASVSGRNSTYSTYNVDFSDATKWTNVGCSVGTTLSCVNYPTSYVKSVPLSQFGIDTRLDWELNWEQDLASKGSMVQIFPESSSLTNCQDCSEDDVFGWWSHWLSLGARCLDLSMYVPDENGTRPRTGGFCYLFREIFTLKKNDTGYYLFRNNKNTLIRFSDNQSNDALGYVVWGYFPFVPQSGMFTKVRVPNFVYEVCTENWQPTYGNCTEGQQFIYYDDANECGFTDDLPDNNGTYITCGNSSANFDLPDSDNVTEAYTGDMLLYEEPLAQIYVINPYNGEPETMINDSELLMYESEFFDSHSFVANFKSIKEFDQYTDGNITLEFESGILNGSSTNWANIIVFGEDLEKAKAREVFVTGQGFVTAWDVSSVVGDGNKKVCVFEVSPAVGSDTLQLDCGNGTVTFPLSGSLNGLAHKLDVSFSLTNPHVKVWIDDVYQGEFSVANIDGFSAVNSVGFVVKTMSGQVTPYLRIDDLGLLLPSFVPPAQLFINTDMVDDSKIYEGNNFTINYNGTLNNTVDSIFNCSLLINNVVNQTSNDVDLDNNQQFPVNLSASEFVHNYQIYCNNSETYDESLIYRYEVDTLQPRIETTVVNGREYTLVLDENISVYANFTNVNLQLYNITIKDSAGVIQESIYANVSPQNLTFAENESLRLASALGVGNYTLEFYAEDESLSKTKTKTFEIVACPEVWSANTSECSLFDYTQLLWYEELNSCGTTTTLPVDNGTYVACTLGACNVTQITSAGRGRSADWIYSNDCVEMRMRKDVYVPTIELIDKLHVGTFRLLLMGIEEREHGTTRTRYTPFASMGLRSNISEGYLKYENDVVDVGYLINETKFKTVMGVNNWDYEFVNSDLWVKVFYKKGTHQIIQYLPPVVDSVTKELVLEEYDVDDNQFANQKLYRGTVIELDPVILCVENWVYNTTPCTVYDNATIEYYDSNLCMTYGDLPADNGTTATCNYCSADWQYAVTTCDEWSTTRYPTVDLNVGTCCNVTNITTDCATPSNTTQGCTGIHSAGNVPEVVIDNIGALGVEAVRYAPLIALIGLAITGAGLLVLG